jgi:molecular chaperone DnaK
MKAAMEKLTAVGGEIYQEAQKAAQAAQAAAGAGAGGAGPAPDQTEAKAEGAGKKTEKKANVVDADFEVVDEDKKK